MLKRTIMIAALIVSPAAFAQAPSSPGDPADVVAAYKMLLQEANDRVATMAAQSQANAKRAAAAEKATDDAKKQGGDPAALGSKK